MKKTKNWDDSSIFYMPELGEELSKVVRDGVCCDLCSAGMVPLGGTPLLGAKHRGLPGTAREAVSHAWPRGKGIKTVRQNWLSH